jgi:hypothetical protein
MAMEERIWRKQGLERAAEICEEMAEELESYAHTFGGPQDVGLVDHLRSKAKVLREATARIRGEG